MKTASLLLSAFLFTACSGVDRPSETNEAKVADGAIKCTPFYVRWYIYGSQFVWQTLCDQENNREKRFTFFDLEKSPHKLVISSKVYPELYVILKEQINDDKERLSDFLIEKLFKEIQPLLVKGDEACIAEAHKIYVKALLDENKSKVK